MRGSDIQTSCLFSYVSCEARVPPSHPLRPIRAIMDEALEVLSPDFEAMYSAIGRPSIPPEKLLRALLLQAFYTIRSERQLMEQMDCNLLFRWFVGLSMDAPIWDVNRVHQKSRTPPGGRHRCKVPGGLAEPAARRTGYGGSYGWSSSHHIGCRQGLRYCRLRRSLAGRKSDASRRPEHDEPTLGHRRSDYTSFRHAVSQRIRKRIEEMFGWTKTSGGMRKARHRGKDRVGWMFTLTATAYNLVRLPKLLQRA